MLKYNPINRYPGAPQSTDWAERLVNDRKIVAGYNRNLRYYDEPFLYQYSVQTQCGIAGAIAGDTAGDTARGRKVPGVQAGGASFDHSIALIKSAGEAAERFSLSRTITANLTHGTFRRESPSINPEHFRFFSPGQLSTTPFEYFRWNDDASFYWTAGRNLITGHAVMLPAQLVYVPYRYGEGESYLFQSTTTGAACGQCVEDSSVRGMLELIERDAFMIHYLNRTEGVRVDFKESSLFSEVEAYLRRFMLCLRIYLLQTDFPVCTALALITDESRSGIPSPWLSAGLKASFDPTRAILGAVEEACQTRPWVRSILQSIELGDGEPAPEVLDDIIVDRALFWSKPDRIPELSFLTKSERVISFSELNSRGGVQREELQTLLQFCSDEGHPVYHADVATPEVRDHGLVVSKILMPTLQQFYLIEPHVPLGSSRWRTVPHKLGLADTELKQPNPIPHFFL